MINIDYIELYKKEYLNPNILSSLIFYVHINFYLKFFIKYIYFKLCNS